MRKPFTALHDDGIFRFEQELVFGQTSISEYALRVIEDFRKTEQRRVGGLRGPVTKVLNIPKKVIMSHMRKTAGQITFAPTQLNNFSTKDEHRNAEHLNSFFEHPMPVYSNRKILLKHHGDHCWQMALLNAYRIIDMMNESSIPLPNGWEKIQIDRSKWNFAMLLASAAYQMGRYHTMATAMARAAQSERGKRMSEGNKGNFSELGKMVNDACDEIVKLDGQLPEWNASREVMRVLEKKKLASTKGARWLVFVGGKKEDIDSKKLGSYIARYRKRTLR